jgi:hypothetical protein
LWESMSSPIFFKPSLTAGFFFAHPSPNFIFSVPLSSTFDCLNAS